MTALVTGAGRGVGRAVAVALARAGHGPLALLARSVDQLEETARQVRAAGADALVLPADVTDDAQLEAAVRRAECELGPVDLLVNDAGTAGTVTRLADGDATAWRSVLATNVVGPAVLTALVLPGMLARGRGRIVNVNSLQGSRTMPGCAAYGASKAALMRLTSATAEECRGTGVVAFDMSPGVVATEMTAMPGLAELLSAVPPEEWTLVERAAEVVIALASGRYDALTGCFVHAEDDLDDLLARMSADTSGDWRRLRVVPAGPDDPLFA